MFVPLISKTHTKIKLERENSTSKMMYKRIRSVILSVFMLTLMTAVYGQEPVKSGVLDDMKEKWSKLFDIMDYNKDGIVDKAERDKHTGVVKEALNSEVKKTVDKAMKNLKEAFQCAVFKYGNNQDKVKKEEYVKSLEDEFVKNPQEFKEHVKACDKKAITSVDINNDGRISWTEYKMQMKYSFVIKEEMLKDDFLKWNPSIQDKEYLKAWLQFQSEDKTNEVDKEMKEGMFDKPKEK